VRDPLEVEAWVIAHDRWRTWWDTGQRGSTVSSLPRRAWLAQVQRARELGPPPRRPFRRQKGQHPAQLINDQLS
jgi:hypothetical protein